MEDTSTICEKSTNRTLTFITTNECGARCAHCLMMSGPERHEKLTFQQIKESIDKYFPKGECGVVVFTGGECTRLGLTLLDAIAYANVRGLFTRIVSNGEWAVSTASTESMVSHLRESGLNEINISVDDYHVNWIPFENIKRIWFASKSRGFATVLLVIGRGPNSNLTPRNAMDRLGERISLISSNGGLTQKLPEPAEDGTVYAISENRFYRLGRGKQIKQSEYFFPDQREVLSCMCPKRNLQAVITPKGHVGACCGINPEGNQLLDFGPLRSDLRPSELQLTFLDAVTVLGPGYLERLIKNKSQGTALQRSLYTSICEICEDISHSQEALSILDENLETIKKDVVSGRKIDSFLE